MSRISIALSVLAILLIRQGSTVERAAQAATESGTPSPAWSGDVSAEELFAVASDSLRLSSGPVNLARVAMTSGATLEIPAEQGPALYFVQSGGIQVVGSGGATTEPAAGVAASSSASATPSTAWSLVAGQLVLLPAGSTATITNVATGAAELIVAEFIARDAEPPAAPGVAWQVLASGDIELPAQPGAIRLDRFTLAPNATLLPYQTPGPEVIAVEAAPVEMALHPGEARIVRSYGGEEFITGPPSDPFATPVEEEDEAEEHEADHAGETEAESPGITPLQGTVAGLSPGDAAFLDAGSHRTIRAVGSEASVVLILAFVPE